MSERKFRVDAHSAACSSVGIGPACFYRNDNPYPVEVTVRRVVEKVVFEGRADYSMPDEKLLMDARVTDKILRASGYGQGQRYRVTIEPL